MSSSASQPASAPQSTGPVPVQAIVALVGKGMTAHEILEAFPALKPEDIRAALLQAVEVVCDKAASLETSDPVGELIERAQQSSGMAEDEAQELANTETRTVRQERAARRNRSCTR